MLELIARSDAAAVDGVVIAARGVPRLLEARLIVVQKPKNFNGKQAF